MKNEKEKAIIAIASDHRGYKLKQKVTKYLEKKGYNVMDLGTNSYETTDYPIYAFKLGETINKNKAQKGILICGSGIGISIAANKVKGIRCAKVNSTKEVKYTRTDNNANVIALSGKTCILKAKDMVDMFLNTEYNNIERYDRRIKQITDYE